MATEDKKLYRSRSNRMVGGVCGGLGEYFDVDPTVVRVLFVLATFITGVIPLIVAYLVMLFVVPNVPEVPMQPPHEPPAAAS